MSTDRVRSQSVVAHQFIDAGGIRTHYLECGDPASPPLVLVHGGGAGAGAMGNWSPTLPLFARAHHVIAPEMVGFGETDKPDPASYEYSQPNRNKHLIDFLDALELGPAPLVGNSMGGATCIGVAMARPDLVSHLVLMGSAGLATKITPELAPILHYDFTIEGMRRMVGALTGPRHKAAEEIVRSRYDDSLKPDTRRAYQSIMAWVGAQGGLFYPEDDIRRVKTPALVINGKEDRIVPLAVAVRFLELLENSYGYIIPHLGHWVMMEAPEEFADAVMRFVARRENAA